MLAATITQLRPQSEPPSRRERLAGGNESDAELVQRLRRGDMWAKEALYRRYVRTVSGLVLRLLGNSADADDVVQDAFVLALEDIDRLREADRFGPWLVRIAVHQVHRRFRRRRLLRALGFTVGLEDATLDTLARSDCPPEVRAELGKVARLLATLPPATRIAWMLRYVEGHSLEDAAGHAGCSLATLKRRVAAASHALRQFVSFEEDLP